MTMHYKQISPCDQCPFIVGSGFTWKSLLDHSLGEFPCHKQCDQDDDGDYVAKSNGSTAHCAGALIFLEKLGKPHQMMRIAERIGFYDRTKLNMKANVVTSPNGCRAGGEE